MSCSKISVEYKIMCFGWLSNNSDDSDVIDDVVDTLAEPFIKLFPGPVFALNYAMTGEDFEGNTDLHIAAAEGYKFNFMHFTQKKNNKKNEWIFVQTGDLDDVREEIEDGEDINVKTFTGDTPLNRAIQGGNCINLLQIIEPWIKSTPCIFPFPKVTWELSNI